MLHKIPLLLFFSFIFLYSKGQECSIGISGNIIDEHDNSVLGYATIYIQELGIGVTADENGKYYIQNLCAGKYNFIIGHLGCEPDTITLDIKQSIKQDFYLEHHAQELSELVATASKNQPSLSTNTTSITALNKLEGKDLSSILNTVVGVSQLKTGTNISKPIIHGFYGDRIYLVNNGVKLETQDWGAEHAPEIDPMAAASIKIIKGTGSLEYGTAALGGMVVMEPPVLKKTKHIKASLSLIGQTNGRGGTTSFRWEQGFKKNIAYFLQGTGKQLGDQQTPAYNLSNTGLQEGNFSTGIGAFKKNWNINAYYTMFHQKVGILKSAQIGNLTDLQNAINSSKPLIVEPFTYNVANPKQIITHHLAKVNIEKYFKNEQRIALTYSFQYNKRKEFDNRRGGRSNIPSLDMYLASNTVLGKYSRVKTFKNDGKLEGKSGFNLLIKHNANNPETGIRPLIPDYYQYSFGVYDLETYRIKNVELEAGIRYDYTRFFAYKFDKENKLLEPVLNYHTYAFSTGVAWKDKKEIVLLQSNLSLNSRFPNASELFSEGLHHGIAVLEFGNENLRPEHSVKWINTITTKYKKYIEASATIHIATLKDYIYLAPLPNPVLTIRGAFPAFQYYQTNARILGADINLDVNPVKFLTLNFKSSIVRGKNKTNKDYLIYLPSDRISAGFELQHDFKRVKNVYFGMNTQHVFKQNKTPKEIIDYKAAPNAYTLLNAEAGLEISIFEKHTLSFSVTGENITNTTYRDYLNKFRYYADEVGWNLIFRIKYSFL